jgi:hypothetical protein
MTQITEGVLDVLKDEKIKFDEKKVETLSNTRYHAVGAMFESKSKLLVSNPSLLFLICTFIFQSQSFEEFFPGCRVEIYNRAVEAAFHSWTKQKSSISKEIFNSFFN